MDNLALSQGGNIAFSSGALANGTNAGTVRTTAAITYVINGVFASRAIVDNLSIAYSGPAVYGTPADGSFTGAVGGSTRLYGLYLNAAGALSVLPGQVTNTAELAAGVAALHFPPMQRELCFIGALRIAVTQGTTFIPGTTALNAAGVTASYLNCSSVPGEPLRS